MNVHKLTIKKSDKGMTLWELSKTEKMKISRKIGRNFKKEFFFMSKKIYKKMLFCVFFVAIYTHDYPHMWMET